MSALQNSKAKAILDAAAKGGYAVPAVCVVSHNAFSLLALLSLKAPSTLHALSHTTRLICRTTSPHSSRLLPPPPLAAI